MSLFDRAINAASDAAKASMANYQRSIRKRAVFEQIAYQQGVIQWSTARIGRLALDAGTHGRPLPDPAQPAAAAIRSWEGELAQLQQQLATLDATLHAQPPGHPGGPGGPGPAGLGPAGPGPGGTGRPPGP
jgi:hypothetical protein